MGTLQPISVDQDFNNYTPPIPWCYGEGETDTAIPILEKGVLKRSVLGPSHTPLKWWDLSSSSGFLTPRLGFSTATCYKKLFAITIVVIGNFY